VPPATTRQGRRAKEQWAFSFGDPFFARGMPPDITCERGRLFRDRCSCLDDAGIQRVSPLRLLRCAPVEMTVVGAVDT